MKIFLTDILHSEVVCIVRRGGYKIKEKEWKGWRRKDWREEAALGIGVEDEGRNPMM